MSLTATDLAPETEGQHPLTAISYGGGVQSTALVVLAATGRIHADVALFANVGDDSEHPDTIRYVHEVPPAGPARPSPRRRRSHQDGGACFGLATRQRPGRGSVTAAAGHHGSGELSPVARRRHW